MGGRGEGLSTVLSHFESIQTCFWKNQQVDVDAGSACAGDVQAMQAIVGVPEELCSSRTEKVWGF